MISTELLNINNIFMLPYKLHTGILIYRCRKNRRPKIGNTESHTILSTTIGINTYHTPHDCRHTFTSLLDSAGVNQVCIDRLFGHASKSLTPRTYTHKSIEELRQKPRVLQNTSCNKPPLS